MIQKPRVDKLQVFRPRLRTWFGRIILPATFFIVLTVTGLNLAGTRPELMWLILAFLPTFGLVVGVYTVPIFLGRVAVDAHGISANVDGMRLRLAWRDVRAAQIVRYDREPYLMVSVSSGLYVVPLRHFSYSAIWEAVVLSAPLEAVRPGAFDGYERKDGNEGISPDLWMVGSLQVADSRGLSAAAALGAAGYGLLFAIALASRLPAAPIYLAFGVIYLLVLTGVGSTELDPKGITRRTPTGVNRILWDELSAVEVGPFSLRIVLEGMDQQRLVLFGPPMWTGPDAARAVHFYVLQISTRRLPQRRSLLTLFKLSRNTRREPG